MVRPSPPESVSLVSGTGSAGKFWSSGDGDCERDEELESIVKLWSSNIRNKSQFSGFGFKLVYNLCCIWMSSWRARWKVSWNSSCSMSFFPLISPLNSVLSASLLMLVSCCWSTAISHWGSGGASKGGSVVVINCAKSSSIEYGVTMSFACVSSIRIVLYRITPIFNRISNLWLVRIFWLFCRGIAEHIYKGVLLFDMRTANRHKYSTGMNSQIIKMLYRILADPEILNISFSCSSDLLMKP